MTGKPIFGKKGFIFLMLVPAFVWASVIFVCSILPVRVIFCEEFRDFLHENKAVSYLIHLSEYMILTALIIWGIFRTRKRIFLKNIPAVIFFGCGYGIAMELIQGFVPWRNPSLADMVANIAGVLMIVFLTQLSYVRLLRR